MAAMYRVSQGAVSLYLSLQIHDCKLDRKTVSHLQIINSIISKYQIRPFSAIEMLYKSTAVELTR